MLFGKDRGPIYSRYDMDRPGNVDPVVDYASQGQSQEDTAFLAAHKITPGQVEPGDIPAAPRTRQEESASLRAFLQLLAPSTAQTSGEQGETSLNRGQQTTSSFYQHRNPRRNQTQNRAVLIGVIIWLLFLLLLVSTVLNAVGR